MNNRLTSPLGIRIIRIIVYVIMLIMLSNIASYAGVGLFMSTYLVGEVIYLILIGGMREALSKMIGARNYRGFHGNTREVLRLAIIYTIVVCIVICSIMFSANKILALLFFRYSINASLFMHLSIFFLLRSIVDILSAYQKGKGNSGIVTLADLLGLLGMLISSFFIIQLVYGYGVRVEALLKNPLMDHLYGAIGMYVCAYIGNALSIIILIVSLFIKRKYNLTEEYKVIRGVDSRRNFFSNIIRIGYKDVSRRVFLIAGLGLISCIFLHNCFRTGISDGDAYSMLGLFMIQYVLFLYVPLGLIMEFINNCLVHLYGDMEADDIKSLRSNFIYSLKNVLFFSLPVFFVYLILGKKIMIAFLGNDLSTPVWIQGGSFAIIFLSMALFSKSVMRVIHYERMSLIIELISLVVTVFTMIIISRNNITPTLLTVAICVGSLTESLIYLYMLYRFIGFNIFDLTVKSVRVVISSLVMAVLLLIGSKIFVTNVLWLTITMVVSYVLYVIASVLIKGILRKDIKFLQGTFVYHPVKYMYSFMGQKF